LVDLGRSPTSDVLRFARETGVRRLLFAQSTTSFTGPCCFDPRVHNCGFRPRFSDIETADKLAVERDVLRHAPNGLSTTFIYLPALLGTGGEWAHLLTEARQYRRVTLPVVANARANHIDVQEVANRLARLLEREEDSTEGIRRLIWVSEISRELTWTDFFRAQLNSGTEIIGSLPWLPFSDHPTRHFACALASSAKAPRFLKKFAGPTERIREQTWQPRPFLRYLMCEQSYLTPIDIEV
jgi:hypothetical protein